MKSLLFASLLLAAPALAAAPPAAPPTEQPAASAGLVFVANTGLEDIGTLTSSLRHAVVAKESGHLDEVTWIVYGRAIVALDPTVDAVPASVRKALEAAQAAGVRIVACEKALAKFDIDPETLPDGVETVPNAITEVSRLVADGHALLRY